MFSEVCPFTWFHQGKSGWLYLQMLSSRTEWPRCETACSCEETTHTEEARAGPAVRCQTPMPGSSAGSQEPRRRAFPAAMEIKGHSRRVGNRGRHKDDNDSHVEEKVVVRHLSQKLLGRRWRLAGCLFEQQADGLNQRRQRHLEGVCQSQVSKEHSEDGHQGRAWRLGSGFTALQVNLQTFDQEGQEGGQVPQNLVSLLGPVDWSVRSWKQHEGCFFKWIIEMKDIIGWFVHRYQLMLVGIAWYRDGY